jgi:hypothetical protein
MYRLMKSERYTPNDPDSGSVSSYQQSEINHYRHANEALTACEMANSENSARHYVLNAQGQEYFSGIWID